MSGQLTISEKKDMAETMEIQKCHFLWPCSDMVGILAMAIRSHWKIGLVAFPITNFGIFQLNGAEIFDVENHKRKSLL